MDRRRLDVARPIAQPLLGYFDRRFQDVHDRLAQRFEELANRVSTEVECISEMTLSMQRFVDLCERRVDDAIASVGQLVAALDERHGGTATGLVEIPFAVASLADRSFPARVVQVGPPTDLAVLLAFLGHGVTVVTHQPVLVTHASITVVPGPVGGWDGPEEPADAVVSLGGDPSKLDTYRRWLHPKGILVASAAGDQPEGDLDRHLAQWDVDERRRYRLVDRAWQPLPDDAGGEGASLVLVRAAPRP